MTGAANRRVWRISEELLKYFRQDGQVYISGQLRVVAETLNLDPSKRVGLRYTLDDWATWNEIDGAKSNSPEATEIDQFVICTESTIPPGTVVQYAIYRYADELTSWDNNHSQNYSAQF